MCNRGKALNANNDKIVGQVNGRRLYTGLRLDCRLWLWAPTSTLHTVSVVAELNKWLASYLQLHTISFHSAAQKYFAHCECVVKC